MEPKLQMRAKSLSRDWRNCVQVGRGEQTYEGNWVLASREGEKKVKVRKGLGTHTYAPGETYEGEWDNDKPNGRGKYTFTSKAVYEGEFVDGAFNGKGTYTWPDGDV